MASEKPNALLSVRDLSVEFPGRRGTLTALDHISFDVARGEVLGIVGESGAGKSLTGRAIIGLLDLPGRMSRGEIRLDGERIDTLTREEMKSVRGSRIAMIFQDPMTSLNPLFPIGEQIIETIQAHGDLDEAAARRKAVNLLQEVGLPAAAQRMSAYPHQLSGGMRQRVVIALALCADPELVIADEPTTALDVSVQAQVLNLMRNLQRELGLTYLLISHDLAVVRHMSDEIGVIYLGRLVEKADKKRLFEAPQHPYTRMLLDAVPRLDDAGSKLIAAAPSPAIADEIPNPIDPPSGCPYHPRCPRRMSICEEVLPELEAKSGSYVACHAVE